MPHDPIPAVKHPTQEQLDSPITEICKNCRNAQWCTWCVVGTSVRDCRPVEGAELDAVIALARAADTASR